MTKRLDWIDAIRGVAMLAIVFGHTISIGPWRIWVYSFNVPLFFVLSGMTFSVKDEFKSFCLKKAKRLLVPYFCFGFASIIVFAIAGSFAAGVLGKSGINTSPTLNIVGLIYGNGKNGMMDYNLPLWFLPCLFIAYLIAYPIVKFEKKASNKILLRSGLMVLSLIAACIIVSIDPVPALPFSAENALAMFPFLYVGVHLKEVKWGDCAARVKGAVGAFSLFFGVALALINSCNGIVDYVVTEFRSYPLFITAALFQIWGLLLICSIGKSPRSLIYVGRNTMPILVMHKFPVVLSQILLSGVMFFEGPALENPFIALLISAVTITLCLLVGRVLEYFTPWVFGQ